MSRHNHHLLGVLCAPQITDDVVSLGLRTLVGGERQMLRTLPPVARRATRAASSEAIAPAGIGVSSLHPVCASRNAPSPVERTREAAAPSSDAARAPTPR